MSIARPRRRAAEIRSGLRYALYLCWSPMVGAAVAFITRGVVPFPVAIVVPLIAIFVADHKLRHRRGATVLLATAWFYSPMLLMGLFVGVIVRLNPPF